MQHDFILLDRSGSMQSQWHEAINSVNAYVEQLAKDKIDTGVTLAVFDGQDGLRFDIIRERIIPSTWAAVTVTEVQPRGMTPLNDATGKIVSLARAGNYDKVAIIIMTDGEENASREMTVQQAKSMLDECRSKNWQVIFLGANFDNAKQATSYGNAAHATAQVATKNLAVATRATASMRASYAATGASMGFTDDEKRRFAGTS